MIVGFTSTYGSCHGHDCMKVMTAIIGRSKSYFHTIMTMTAIIGRSKSYYHTIMTMKATIGRSKSSWSDCMIVRFTSTYGSCHGQIA
jgi:hypothetical protein